ncbi:DNA glycosylase AlkZ-like family protein [Zhihengliuella flava]|uniref:Uncharacterized protein YcaQ n=1 Tax=Zhihengliuella flava TaxID=1285193 RepID=A0A931D5T9_9MICC|nr:crosslink repair DNA glycosylase YcaQ family protein [Zhihengliuella flava]MBG6084959.1 uncharacterized protein YcaQ [Zhihengliuella flava]
MLELSAAEARRAVVNAHFAVPAAHASDVLENERLIQLDGISRVDKAHRLTVAARLSARHRAQGYDAGLWGSATARSFETFTDVACLFPLGDWPLFELSRRGFRDRMAAKGTTPPPELKDSILRIVADAEGGATIGDIEDGGPRGGSWGWSERQKAAEFMLWCGELVCTRRSGIKRLFDLPASRIPAHLLNAELSEQRMLTGLVASALRALGLATVPDLRRHYRLSADEVRRGLEGAGAVVVRVEGWGEEAYALAEPDTSVVPTTPSRGSRMIGPFDNLLRNRKRAARIFGYEYLFEAYVPQAKRTYGAYVLSVLHGDRFVARADAQRQGRDVHLHRVFGEPGVPGRIVDAAVRRAGNHLAKQLGGELVRSQG